MNVSNSEPTDCINDVIARHNVRTGATLALVRKEVCQQVDRRRTRVRPPSLTPRAHRNLGALLPALSLEQELLAATMATFEDLYRTVNSANSFGPVASLYYRYWLHRLGDRAPPPWVLASCSPGSPGQAEPGRTLFNARIALAEKR